MQAYEGGGHLYHTTMPTDALARTRDAMLETRARGFAKLTAEQERIGAMVRALLERHGYPSVAAEGFKAPCVVVSYTDDAGLQSSKAFVELGLQTAAGVPLQCDEGADFKTFRIGLFGLEKLGHVERTASHLEKALQAIARRRRPEPAPTMR
jgi:aspartate aminotransferase-like enzyme